MSAVEVERKFVVRDPPDLEGADADEIEQGYLAIGAEGEVRVRRRGDRLLLTAKRGEGLSRQEAEIELDRERFDLLWPLTEGRRLRKRRLSTRRGRSLHTVRRQASRSGTMRARVLRVGDTSMGAVVARAALQGDRRSDDVEAGGVTRDSNAHLTAS